MSAIVMPAVSTFSSRRERSGYGAAPTMTGPYEQQEFLDDLYRVTGGQTDKTLAEMTIARSRELLPFMDEQRVRFQPPLGGTLSLGKTNAFFLGGGRGMLNALYRRAEALGVTCLYDTPVTGLTIEDGFFVSATVKHQGRAQQVRGKALVAACGGFEANIEWLKQYWGEAADNFLIRGTPYNRGDVLRMLLDKGVAAVGDPTQCHAVAIDARAPKFDGGIATRLDSVIFGIMVNRQAQRFYDEGEDTWPKRYAIWGRLVAQQPEQIGYSIIDSQSIHLFMPSIFPAITAQSIPELAGKLDLDPAALAKTVDDFNAAVRPGTFDHTGLDNCRTEGLAIPKTHWARRIDKPPYYAYPLRPGITFTYLGVRVNEESRMMLEGGKPSGNMFAAGEIMAGNVLGKGYLAGIGMTIGAVFGRVAGEGAAKHARN